MRPYYDSGGILYATNFVAGVNSTATSTSAYVMTVASAQSQAFIAGSGDQPVFLPTTGVYPGAPPGTAVYPGSIYYIYNYSANNVLVYGSVGITDPGVITIVPGGYILATVTTGSGNTIASTWNIVAPVTGTPGTNKLPLTTGVSGVLPIVNGGTNLSALPTTSAASTYAAWDSNSNIQANNTFLTYTSIATTGGTTTLTAASNRFINFTFASGGDQTVLLPALATIPIGSRWEIRSNVGAGTALLVKSADGVTQFQKMFGQNGVTFSFISTASSGNTGWVSVSGGRDQNDSVFGSRLLLTQLANITSSTSYTYLGILPGIISFTGSTASQTITIPTDSATNNGVIFTVLNTASVTVSVTGTATLTLQPNTGLRYHGMNGVWKISLFNITTTGTPATLPIANGGTNLTALPTTTANSTFAAWDANGSMPMNKALITSVASISTNTSYTLAQLPGIINTTGGTFNITIPNDSAANNGYSVIVNNKSTAVTIVSTSNFSAGTNSVYIFGAGGFWNIIPFTQVNF